MQLGTQKPSTIIKMPHGQLFLLCILSRWKDIFSHRNHCELNGFAVLSFSGYCWSSEEGASESGDKQPIPKLTGCHQNPNHSRIGKYTGTRIPWIWEVVSNLCAVDFILDFGGTDFSILLGHQWCHLEIWKALELGFIGFLRGGCSRGGGNWGTLRIPREDWGTLGKIRGITTPVFECVVYWNNTSKWDECI